MDKVVKKKRFSPKLIAYISVPIILGLVYYFLINPALATYVISRSEIIIKEVKKDQFEDVILINGNAEPITSVFVNVLEGGMISEIMVENGSFVKKGQPIVQIYNPNVVLNYLTQETAIIEQINNLRNTKFTVENRQRELTDELYALENDLLQASRQYIIDTALYSQDIIARQEYDRSVDNYSFQQKRSLLLETNVQKEIKQRGGQINRINTSIDLMERNLEILRKNRENLTIKAPISGQLSSFNPVIGQNFNSGTSIGKIDVLDGYLVSARVDEYYITKVRQGLKAWITIEDKKYLLEVRKVFPEVLNSQFRVELIFTAEVPESLRRGQSLQVRLELSGASESILIPRGGFYQSSGGKWVFVVKDNLATKRQIRLGRQNPNYYEVLEGLEAGESIITSSYEHYKDLEKIEISE